MGITRAAHAEVIRGTTEDCLAALTDFESYPSWQSAVRSATVTERGADGATTVAFEIDVKVRTIRYALRYRREGDRLWWEDAGGDLKHIDGDYTFEELGDGTVRATYRVGIDPGRFVPGPVRKLLVEGVMRGSVRELRHRVERDRTQA